jgi:hypothetical protein
MKVRALKKKMQTDIAYSFGPSANMVNVFSKTGKEKVWLGLRNYTDVEESVKIRIFTRLADLIICCSKTIEKELETKFGCRKTATLYNLYDVWQRSQSFPGGIMTVRAGKSAVWCPWAGTMT